MNWLSKDRNCIWHPFTPQKDMDDPIFIERGEGVWLIDEKGNRYLDAISSWWVNLHGHAHPYIAKALFQQASKLEHIIFAGFTHAPAIRLAEALLSILPKRLSRVFYSDNGSTSTEVAMKMAIQYWWNKEGRESNGRKKLLAFRNSYHGDTFGAMSVSDRSVFTLAFHDLLFEVVFIDTPEEGNIESLEAIIDREGDGIAAFIYEPLVQGAGGIRMYEAKWLERLIRKARSKSIICIADEVMTGFGRTGKLFASEYMEEQPDIICLSKGLTGGVMPLGVTACADFIYQAYVTDDRLKTFFHGHSFTANPLACTAALASLELLKEEAAIQGIRRITESNIRFLTRLQAMATNNEAPIKNPRALGTILAFEISSGKDEYLNKVSPVVTRMAMEKGIYIRPLGNTVYLMPPYCISDRELALLEECICEILMKF
ncbi:adenosylmethionine--8-amino-7-oxononanoate transaminase [Flavihumibacter rivuli]|uniref:adenosylmethionine--8-amino-7-oxononanoate transaminase n=1 Tax=Flavihumibacter rivuli TaxID=2838156 RepID=UPI001BDF29B4|nr:adenosylmethionine--8-amino-7-oxononanoate transaminase [Flavihumibacter rivuli]